MGPALGGLDKLLRLPTGCGEQNMLLFAPNIYVLEYLGNTDQLTSSVRDKAIDFLHTGIFKGFPYSLPRVGPGADTGVQAVSPQLTISHPPGGRCH